MKNRAGRHGPTKKSAERIRVAPRKLDLNLFRVFDAVMRHRSLTAASRELHLTPSAVSHALSRLRSALADPLFVATEAGMEPTVRALELAPHVSAGLARIETALRTSEFVPARTPRTFRIAASDYASVTILPQLAARIAETAPEVDLRIFPFNRVDTIRQLDDSRIDVVAGWFGELPSHLRRRLLLEDRETIVARAGHPLASGAVTRERLVEFPHVVVELTGSAGQTEDGFIDEEGASRRVWIERLLLELRGGAGDLLAGRAAIVVPHYGCVLPIVTATDLIATLPWSYVRAEIERGRVVALDLPYPPLIGRLEAVWHRRSDRDAGVAWLVDRMADALAPAH